MKDAALREVYRSMYPHSAHRTYALSAPFCERIFQLARQRGYTGQITANSFIKREFGKRLVEEFLPGVNIECIVNTSGAYIPGHGTPTVLLFGTLEAPRGADALAVLAKRGEPSTPAEPSQGLVWRSIVEHGEDLAFDNDYISVARISRQTLAKHPWSLGGGGASELKELLEERASGRLSDLVATPIGRAARIGADDVFSVPPYVARMIGEDDTFWRDLLIGEAVRDWSTGSLDQVAFPYDVERGLAVPETNDPRIANLLRFLWPWRTLLAKRATFQGAMADAGLQWFEYMQYTRSANTTPLSIAFAFVATHNHFVLDRGGKVFNRSAPIIKLPEGATEDDHLALLAYLNSSTACFWMKQVFHKKSSASQKHHTDPARAAYEFAGTGLLELPLPQLGDPMLVELGRRISQLGAERAAWLSGDGISLLLGIEREDGLGHAIEEGWTRYDRVTEQAAYLQEELDWHVYQLFQLTKTAVVLEPGKVDALGARPFEAALGYNAGLSDRVGGGAIRRSVTVPKHWGDRRLEDVGSIMEAREFKRMWRDTELNVDQAEFRISQSRKWLEGILLARLENKIRDEREVVASRVVFQRIALDAKPIMDVLAEDSGALLKRLMAAESVPHLASLRYSEDGLACYAEWLATWAAQRAEDQGRVADAKPAPKYEQSHFLAPEFWRLRGKLDVPKERFISYPHCESDQDGEPVYGWAGWDHLQRAQALASLYLKRKDGEGWTAARLTPMLAGLLELIPWVKQWHNEPSTEFDGLRMGDYFEKFLDGECRQHGLTHDDLRAWRPPKKSRGKPAQGKRTSPAGLAPTVSSTIADGDEAAGTPPPKARRTRAKSPRPATAAEPAAAEPTE